jgi:hypothetical protein
MKNLLLSVFICTLIFSGCGAEKKETAVDPDSANKLAALAILKKLESYTEVGISYQEFSSRLLDINAELDATIEPIQDQDFRNEAKDILKVYADSSSYWGDAIKYDTLPFEKAILKADYHGYPELPNTYSSSLTNKFWTIAQRKLNALKAGPGSYTAAEKSIAEADYFERQQSLADRLAAEEEMQRLKKIKIAIENGNYQEVLSLDPKNTKALSMKKEADIAKALATGDYEAALKLEPTNEQALAMQADSDLKKALEDGDFEAALKLDPANEQALNMQSIKSALDRGDFKAALKIDPKNETALSLKTAAYVELLKGNLLVIPDVYSLSYSPDGRNIAVISKDRRLLILDSETGKEKLRFLGAIKKDIRSAVFSPDGKNILTQSEDGEPKVWNLEKKRFSKTFRKTTHAAYSPDGNSIVTANAVRENYNSNWKPITITILDAITSKENANQIQTKAIGYLEGITYSPDGKSFILQLDQSEYYKGRLQGEKETGYQVLNAEKLTTTVVLYTEGSISMACSPDGKSIAASSLRSLGFGLGFGSSEGSEGGLKLWDAQTGEEKFEVKSAVGKVFFSPDGESIILAPDDGIEGFG